MLSLIQITIRLSRARGFDTPSLCNVHINNLSYIFWFILNLNIYLLYTNNMCASYSLRRAFRRLFFKRSTRINHYSLCRVAHMRWTTSVFHLKSIFHDAYII